MLVKEKQKVRADVLRLAKKVCKSKHLDLCKNNRRNLRHVAQVLVECFDEAEIKALILALLDETGSRYHETHKTILKCLLTAALDEVSLHEQPLFAALFLERSRPIVLNP